MPEDEALSVKWNISKDTFGFQTKMAENSSTRRRLLSMLSSIYDPNSLGAPFLLKGRLIIQQLSRDTLNWDKPIDEKSSNEWLNWKNTLFEMENINTQKWYKPTDCNQTIDLTSSETGYGRASYLRMIIENADVHYCLVFGK